MSRMRRWLCHRGWHGRVIDMQWVGFAFIDRRECRHCGASWQELNFRGMYG